MKKYLALYNATPEAFARWQTMSEEDQKTDMAAWEAWMKTCESSFVDQGNPVGANTRITKDGFNTASNNVGGYSVVQAESAEAAAAIFEGCPHLDEEGAFVELMEVVDMM